MTLKAVIVGSAMILLMIGIMMVSDKIENIRPERPGIMQTAAPTLIPPYIPPQ
jgi:hypothetical protein